MEETSEAKKATEEGAPAEDEAAKQGATAPLDKPTAAAAAAEGDDQGTNSVIPDEQAPPATEEKAAEKT